MWGALGGQYSMVAEIVVIGRAAGWFLAISAVEANL
jgi:hypothetical protein